MANLALTGYQKDAQGIFILKDSDANIKYSLDFVDYLNTGDSLATVTVTIGTISGDSAPLAFPTGSGTDVNISGTKAIFRVHAGTTGNIYPIEVKITTANGDTDARHFRIVVKDKGLQ
tara:strand:+ start:1844 stop:2197 length:354 start_codon:yes stop_codon:yes gene_type:complete